MKCIFCPNTKNLKNIEHIVPESLGNKKYILDSDKICDGCNNKFSKFENKALLKTILGFERARLGVVTKKGKAAKGTYKGMEWTANLSGDKNDIIARGFHPDTLKQIGTNLYQIRIPMYDKDTNVATSKLLLKIGIEAVKKSIPEIASKYDFTDAVDFLLCEKNFNWSYAIPKTYVSKKFNDFVSHDISAHLESFQCRLSYRELNGNLLFRFKYGGFTGLICLNSPETNWISDLKNEKKSKFTVCPEYHKEHSNIQ